MHTKQTSYNTYDTALVITSFPNPTNGKYGKRDFNAVGEHSERRLPYLATFRKVLVAAEQSGKITSFSPTNNILVARIWEKGNVFSFITLARFILAQDQITSILVQFEFNVFGGTLPNIALLLLLCILRLHKKQITFEMHQVITDIAKLEKHVPVKNIFLQKFYNTGLAWFYKTVGFLANQIIVFEEEMKIRLIQFVKEEKIHVLPLSVDKQPILSKATARKKLNLNQKEFIVMVFGYINGYKGIDWLIEAMKPLQGKNVRLLIAGGKNPYLQDKVFYQTFYNSIVNEAKKYAHITHTDFIPDEKVHLYFSAVDLLVMPYEVCMSASGPFSRALAFEKPVILSTHLGVYAKSLDVQQAFKQTKLQMQDIFFPLNAKAFEKRIEKIRKNKAYKTKLALFSKTLKSLRSSEEGGKKLHALLILPFFQPVISGYKVTLLGQ